MFSGIRKLLQAAVGSSGFIWFLRPIDLDETLRMFLDALGIFRDGCSFILGSCLQQGGFRDSDDKHPDASQCLSLWETFQGQFCQLALHIIYLARILPIVRIVYGIFILTFTCS